jgi:hypothetical protein
MEVGASREQLETILQQNRDLEEQTRVLEQEVQRLRDALRDNSSPQQSEQIPQAEPTASSVSTLVQAAETDQEIVAADSVAQPVSSQPPLIESVTTPKQELEQAKILAPEPPSLSGVVLGGMVLLLGYWSVFGPYIRTRFAFLGAGT